MVYSIYGTLLNYLYFDNDYVDGNDADESALLLVSHNRHTF